MPVNPAVEFERLWTSASTPPNVFAFLRRQGQLSVDQIVDIIRLDQRHRWRTSSPLSVEQYLAEFPEIEHLLNVILELTASEFLVRRQLEHSLQIEEYTNRFPELRDHLFQKLSGLSSSDADHSTFRQVSSAGDGMLEIDRICDDFEKAWKSEQPRPALEAYIQTVPGSLRPLLLRELLRVELCCRQETGEKPTLDEYRSRFPTDDPLFNDVLETWKEHPDEFLLYDAGPDIVPLATNDRMTTAISSTEPGSVSSGEAHCFGHFRILSELGRGAFACVYRAHDEQLDRIVAIKVPLKSRFKNAGDAEAYLTEARMVARLEHPNIVPVYQAERTADGSVYVVSRLIEGHTLEGVLRDSRLTPSRTAELISQIARALHYAHQQRLIHRDIKPANILIENSTGKPFVADFGLAMNADEDMRRVVIAGSPGYMSPEQARAEGHRVDGRSDVFSLGVVMYAMLTGQQPFSGSTVYETLVQITSIDPLRPRALADAVPSELERICLKSMNKRASERYATAEQMAEDLEVWLQSSTEAVLKSKASVQLIPRGLRNRAMAVVIGMLIISGVVFARQSSIKRSRAEAARIVEGLLSTETALVDNGISRLKGYRVWADPLLIAAFDDSADETKAKLNSGLALVTDTETPDAEVLQFLQERLLTLPVEEFSHACRLLEPHKLLLIPLYRQVAVDELQTAPRRFHAACALAAYRSTSEPPALPKATAEESKSSIRRESTVSVGDPWARSGFSEFVARQLVSLSHVHLERYQELLRPVGNHLVPALSDIFTNPETAESARSATAILLSDYAADDVVKLSDLLLIADPPADKVLFPKLQQHQQEAVQYLKLVIARRVRPDWKDLSPDPTWTGPSQTVKEQIASAHGLIDERFIFCCDMPWTTFLEVANSLRDSGYRPTRVRPWGNGVSEAGNCPVAALWTRDDKRWEIQAAIPKEIIAKADDPATGKGLLLADLSAFPPLNSAVDSQWVAIWSESEWADEERRVVIDTVGTDLSDAQSELAQLGFISQCTFSVRTDALGERRYTGIWSNRGAASNLMPAYPGHELVHAPQWDVSVAPTAAPLTLADAQEDSDRYAACWRADTSMESKLLAGLPMSSVLERLQPFLDMGYRPVAVAVDQNPPAHSTLMDHESDRNAVTAPDQGTTGPFCSVVLHRPVISDSAKAELAQLQAAAATALIRMNEDEEVWPLFKHQRDLQRRTLLLSRLAKYSIDPAVLINQLKSESDVSCQRALIIALGEFAEADLLTDEQRIVVVDDLTKRYADDPDPGVHGAAEWSLRKLEADEQIAAVSSTCSTGGILGNRRWFLTRPIEINNRANPETSAVVHHQETEASGTGITFAVIDAQQSFLMGSPVTEPMRYGGPVGDKEILHRRLIGRTYAISSHEITVEQFQVFRKDHPFNSAISRENDAPANMISWYDAAAFCNWLSARESIPQSQWCYDADHPFAEGMPLLPDYLQRTGYRLPTEAEWEYACRAGTTTAWPMGESPELLTEYAWYTDNSLDRWMLPVGSLKPNDFGLFDMQGNVTEWCQEVALPFNPLPAQLLDSEQSAPVTHSLPRLLRGASLYNHASDARSAARGALQPDLGLPITGLRVARTLLPAHNGF